MMGSQESNDIKNIKNINELEVGSHICCIYETEDEHQKLLNNLLFQGLNRNEKVFYISDAQNAKDIHNYLKNNGEDIKPYEESNQFQIIYSLKAYLDESNFDPDKLINFLQNETSKAVSEGYSALRATIDMSKSIPGVNHLLKLIEYDSKLNEFFPNSNCLAICLYDIRWLKPKVLLDVFSNHPVVVIGNNAFDNQYYQTSNEVIIKKPLKDTIKDINLKTRTPQNDEENLLYLSNAVQMSMDSIVISNMDGKIIDANDATLRMCEIKNKDDLVGKDLFSFLIPEKNEITINNLKNMLNEGIKKAQEFKILTNAGSNIFVESNIDLMKDEEGMPIGYIGIFKDISERKFIENKLKESEEKYKTLFNASPEGIALVDLDGRILDCNGVVEKITGKNRNELIGKPIMELQLFSEEDISRLIEIFPKVQTANSLNPIDMAIKFGEDRGWVEVYPAIVKRDDEVSALQLIVRDITERKQTEEEMKRRLMKFILDDGKIYLVKETIPTKSLEAFKDLLKVGYNGLVVSRTPENEFRKMINNGNFEYLWLAENESEKTILPRLQDIENRVEKLFKSKPNKYAILIGRIDYLIFKNNFKKTLSFIQRLRELAYLSGNIIIISANSGTLSTREQRLLEVECRDIKPRLDKKMLAEEQFKLLRYIYECNIIGVKPSYTDIGQELGISKPTVRKRIRLLISAGYVMELVKGRNKIIELTQMGKNFFIR